MILICRKHRLQGVYKRDKAWSKKGLRKSRLQDIRVSTPRVVRTNMRKDSIRARRLLLCECLRKRKIESKLHKGRILKRRRKGDLGNKIKEQLALTSRTAIPWRIATSVEQWFTIFKFHYETKWKFSRYSNRDDNNWSQKERKANKRLTTATLSVSARFLHTHGRSERATCQRFTSSAFQREECRTLFNWSRVRSDPTTFVFGPLSPSLLFFLLPLYYRCRFFPGIRGANIPLWQATVLQAEQISTFPQLLFGEANVRFRRNTEMNVGKSIDLYTLHASIDHVGNANGGYNRSAVALRWLHLAVILYRYIPINHYSIRLCD